MSTAVWVGEQMSTKADFLKDGFLILKSESIFLLKEKISKHLCEVAEIIVRRKWGESDNIGGENPRGIQDLLSTIHSKEENNEITRACYEVFPSTAQIMSLCDEAVFVDAAKMVGVQYPTPGTVPLVRIDRPNADHFLTPWHQDYWYSFLCDNSIVIWTSLGEVTEDMGLLEVIPGSHLRGVVPFKKYEKGAEPYEPVESLDAAKPITVATAKDEILVFNQKLLHRSGKNRSNTVRVSLQIRYNDLMTAKEMTSTFTANHSSFVQNAQSKYIAANGR